MPPTENCSSNSKGRPSLGVGRVSMKRLPLSPSYPRSRFLLKVVGSHTACSGERQTNPRTADWGPAAPSVAIHATRRRAPIAAVHSTTVRTGSMSGPRGKPCAAIAVQIAQHLTHRFAYGPERAAMPGAIAPVRSTQYPPVIVTCSAHDCPSVLLKTENHISHRLARMFSAGCESRYT